jgi:hypothetical protein
VIASLLLTLVLSDWRTIAPGVEYARAADEREDIHAVRVNLQQAAIRVIATNSGERGLRVSEFAKKRNAIVAINANYFDEKMQPLGLASGPCGVWPGAKDTARWGVVGVGRGRAAILPQKDVLKRPSSWMTSVVSGWPLLAQQCQPFTAKELPGSDRFTHSPHARSAVGLSRDRKTLLIVVADGRRNGVRGLTLARLAEFMVEELGACTVMNLDGGGSSALWIDDRIVNQPSDGFERNVGNHLGVIHARDEPRCDSE